LEASNDISRKQIQEMFMKKSGIVLVAISLIVGMASLAASGSAEVCTTCGGEGDWGASASAFLEGKPINDTPSSLSNPQQARLKNDLNSNLLKEDTIDASNARADASILNISLIDARAVPNPVNSGSPVMITAIFSNSSSNSPGNAALYNVSAIIKNPENIDVDKTDLIHSAGGEYAGIWLADVPAGVYEATIVASANGASKTFNDTLRIEVSKAA
jgi:hypothetical protein